MLGPSKPQAVIGFRCVIHMKLSLENYMSYVSLVACKIEGAFVMNLTYSKHETAKPKTTETKALTSFIEKKSIRLKNSINPTKITATSGKLDHFLNVILFPQFAS